MATCARGKRGSPFLPCRWLLPRTCRRPMGQQSLVLQTPNHCSPHAQFVMQGLTYSNVYTPTTGANNRNTHGHRSRWKKIFANRSKQTKAKAGEKMDKKVGKGQSVCWKAWWRQGNIKCAVNGEYASCWVHQDCHVADKQKTDLKKATGVSGGNDECQVQLKWRERDFWIATEIGMLGGYGFQGKETEGKGADKKGKMGTAYNDLRRKKKKQQCKVERDEEGSSSNSEENNFSECLAPN